VIGGLNKIFIPDFYPPFTIVWNKKDHQQSGFDDSGWSGMLFDPFLWKTALKLNFGKCEIVPESINASHTSNMLFTCLSKTYP